MKKLFRPWLVILALLLQIPIALALVQTTDPATLVPGSQMGRIVVTVARVIENYHYKKVHLNNELSEQILKRYLETLDPNHSFFSQADVDKFSFYKTYLDDYLRIGQTQVAFDIFVLYGERVKERIDYALSLLKKDFDFTIDESYLFDRSKAPWPKNQAELDELWRKRVKNDFLSLRLADKKDAEIREILKKRYEGLSLRVRQFDAEDVFQTFVNAYTTSIEPHTSYMSPSSSENFDISMRLSLEGIGAILRADNEFVVIQKIVPGGPADQSRQVHAGDKIVAVGQGAEGNMEDVVGWRLQDVVEKIRGPKNTTVRIELIPKNVAGVAKHKIVSIVRNEIRLEEQAAKQYVISGLPGMGNTRIGVITIPTFYRDFRGESQGNKDFRSTTRDVRLLIKELKAAQVDGIVIDLRQNGGGSLSEATELTGLFIGRGPVVQVRDSSKKIEVEMSSINPVYSGPLAVLVDRNSASASEIFAGAIQDYQRGIIIGETTFGKGTVQTLLDINRHALSTSNDMGKLRLTMAQFFRVNGESTQHRGVVPNIAFPMNVEFTDQGERSLENALPWASIAPAHYTSRAKAPVNYTKLIALSEKRVKQDQGFLMLIHQKQWLKTLEESKTISLQEKKRREESGKLEQRIKDERKRYLQTQGIEAKNIDYSQDDSEYNSEADEKEREVIDRIQLNEAAHILADFIHMQTENKTKTTVIHRQ